MNEVATGAARAAGEEARSVRLAERMEVAEGFGARLRGLIGRRGLERGQGLFIAPCSSVHTFGMSFPIDVVFVGEGGEALALYPDLAPLRATRWVPGARAVVELPAGTVAERGLRVGQRVEVPRPLEGAPGGGRLARLGANLLLGAFWLFLAARMLPALAGGAAGLSAYLLFAVNSLIAFLFIARRPERRVSESGRDRLVTLACIVMSFSLRPAPGEGLPPGAVSSAMLAVSLALVLAAYLSLGRSFGLIPADRGLKLGGMYAWVRHPLYGAEMLFFGSFVLANFTLRNLAFAAGVFFTIHLRALAEERLLRREGAYEDYCARVRARYIPFLI